jgi:hypothetical protein
MLDKNSLFFSSAIFHCISSDLLMSLLLGVFNSHTSLSVPLLGQDFGLRSQLFGGGFGFFDWFLRHSSLTISQKLLRRSMRRSMLSSLPGLAWATVLCVLAFAVLPSAKALGPSLFSRPDAAFVSSCSPLGLRLFGTASAVSMRAAPPVLGLRMDRKDGGSKKISSPGKGGGVSKPGGPGGAGVGDREQERGGAGVAVLTKPPELDKVRCEPGNCAKTEI